MAGYCRVSSGPSSVRCLAHDTERESACYRVATDAPSEIPLSFRLNDSYSDFQGAVYLAVLHQVASDNASFFVGLVDIFRNVEFDPPKKVLVAFQPGSKLLEHFQLELTVLQHLISVYREPD